VWGIWGLEGRGIDADFLGGRLLRLLGGEEGGEEGGVWSDVMEFGEVVVWGDGLMVLFLGGLGDPGEWADGKGFGVFQWILWIAARKYLLLSLSTK